VCLSLFIWDSSRWIERVGLGRGKWYNLGVGYVCVCVSACVRACMGVGLPLPHVLPGVVTGGLSGLGAGVPTGTTGGSVCPGGRLGAFVAPGGRVWSGLGVMVGLTNGDCVVPWPLIIPPSGLKGHSGLRQQMSVASMTMLHCAGMLTYRGHLHHRKERYASFSQSFSAPPKQFISCIEQINEHIYSN
jgi:hypothetical protein